MAQHAVHSEPGLLLFFSSLGSDLGTTAQQQLRGSPTMSFIWHIMKKERKLGPYTGVQLQPLAVFGQLKTDDGVGKDDLRAPLLAGKILELIAEVHTSDQLRNASSPLSCTRTNGSFQVIWGPLVLASSKNNPGSQGRHITPGRILCGSIRAVALLGLLLVFSGTHAGAQATIDTDQTGNEPAEVPAAGASAEQVVAEGVGASADEALKDAFRNAVRQVVGAVVDEETRIKNEEVISDKVLTYSNGFINRYEELQRKMQGGLHRIKIKATVERLGIVAKLKEYNIKIKDVPGNSLFQDLHSVSVAKALIAKTFSDYPANVTQAIVKGKPSIENRDGGAVLVYEVELSVDLAKYNMFQKQATELLRRVAQQRGECFVIANKLEGGRKGGSGSFHFSTKTSRVDSARHGGQGNSPAPTIALS